MELTANDRARVNVFFETIHLIPIISVTVFNLGDRSRNKNCMQDFLKPYFAQLDEELAMDGVPIHKRPFDAAWKFVRQYILEVRVHEGPSHAPGNLADYAKEEWFHVLHTQVNAWYRDRYGTLLESGRSSIFRGITLYACTPFEIEIPRTTVRQGKPGETIWLGFPARVSEEEDAEKWVVALPNTDTYSPEALTLPERRLILLQILCV